MTERRGSGEGSIYRFRDGWEVSLDVSLGGGKRVRRRRRARTKPEAREKLKQLQREADAGVVSSGSTTVTQFLDEWIAHVLPARNVTVATIDNYTWAVESHIKPALGKIRLKKLSPEDVDGLLRDLGASALARSTVRSSARCSCLRSLTLNGVATSNATPRVFRCCPLVRFVKAEP